MSGLNIHTIDNKEYVLKTEVTARIQEIMSEQTKLRKDIAAERDTALSDLQAAQKQVGKMEALQRTNGELTTALDLARLGITDADVSDLMVWQHSRAQAADDKTPPIGEWVREMKDGKRQAPTTLQPHIASLKSAGGEGGSAGGEGAGGQGGAGDGGDNGAGGQGASEGGNNGGGNGFQSGGGNGGGYQPANGGQTGNNGALGDLMQRLSAAAAAGDTAKIDALEAEARQSGLL